MLDQLDVASAGERPLIERIVRGRLVARDQELAEAIAIWRKAMAGESGVLLISGAPGVGKTRLANEVIAHARLFGAQVLEGGCYEYEATTPYLPLTEALGDWAHAQATETLRERLGTTAAELARLVPEIQARLGPIAPNTPLPPDQERLRLFDHVARFLQSLAAPGGLLLFVDDLHWADHGTLSLIHYLLRRLRHERWLILGAYRDVELDRMHPLSASLVEWNRERWATRVQLSPLTLDGCSAMLAALFGQASVSPEFAQAIYRETEGNPFFIEEVIKSLIEQGQIYREAVRWERKAIAELTIPQSIKDAIGRRLNRLSADNLEVLQHAAVLGKTFDFTELSAAFGVAQPEDRLLDALDAALGAQLIQAGERNAFTFTHDKIRQALYEELNPIRRRRMHQYIGQGLERLYAGAALDAHVQDLAHHFLNSGDLDKALRYSVSAAEQARQLYAFDEALKYCKYAAESAEALNLTDQLPGLNETLGDIRSDRGVFFEAVENYQRALALTSSRDRQAHLKAKIGLAYAQVGDEHGLELLRSAQGELDPAIHPDDLARVLMALGRYHHYCAQHMQAIACLEQARELAEPSDDPFTLLHIYAFLAGAYQHLARYDESLHWARQCIALGERKNYPPAIALGHEFLSEDFCVMGRWPAGLEHARLDLQIGEKIGAQDRVAWSAYGHTFGLFGLGRLKEAREAAQFGLEMADQIGDNRLSVWLSCLLALIKTDLGADDAAQASADVALSRADELGQVVLQCWSRYALAYVHLARQEWDRALQVCQQGVELYTPTENRISRLVLGSVLAEALSGTGRLDEAIAHLAEYVPFARQSQWHHFEAVALRVQGQVLAAQSQWEAAEYAFGDAIAKLDELGSRLELGRALVHRARLRWTMGHTDSADADVMRARALFQECGAVRDAALAADLDE
jgi:tetratricopeptide (TPR) repeat protein